MVEAIIENSEFSHNLGGGVYINSCRNGSSQCTVYNNVAQYEEGVSVDLCGNSSIEFNNYTYLTILLRMLEEKECQLI